MLKRSNVKNNSKGLTDVTIIIKAFERPESVKKLLNSICQFYPSIPIIIADDSRKPNPEEITSRFPNVEYIFLPFDVGLSAGRNVLLTRIKTKYFVLCDDDFIFDEKTRLAEFKKILDETDVELVGGYFHEFDANGEFSKTHLYAGDLVLDSARHLRLVVLTPAQPFVRCDIVPNFFMADTKAVVQKTGGWDPELKVEEHTDFFWRAKKAGLKVAFCPDVSVNHQLAGDESYDAYRHARVNTYHLIFFKKSGIRRFTDTWETISWHQVQPWFVIVLRWRKFWKKRAKPTLEKIQAGMKSFILEQRWKDLKWSRTLPVKKAMVMGNKKGVILMYHRVTTLEYDPWQLAVTPDRFAEHMQVIKKYGLPVQMSAMGENSEEVSSADNQIVVTFDDGYADNFHNAKPILEKEEVPATFFIVSGVINSREEYWWDELERIILAAPALPEVFEVTIAGEQFSFPIISESSGKLQTYKLGEMDIPHNNTALTQDQLYFTLWRILSLLSLEEKKAALRQIALWSKNPLTTRSTYLPMTTQELLSLARCPLFEIGAHTASHPILPNVSLQEQEQEIGRSKRDLEKILRRKITSFSYPHGAYTDKTVQIVENLKFQAACTTKEQVVVGDISPYLLPRFTVLNWDGAQFEEQLNTWLAQA